jgi:hypothetical protein
VNKGKMGGSSFMVLLNDFGRLTLRKRFSWPAPKLLVATRQALWWTSFYEWCWF